MAIYDINFYNKVVELLPPDKRFSKMVQWVRSFITAIQYSADRILHDFRVGNTSPLWIVSVVYPKGARVIYRQVVYESLVDGNTDIPPSAKWAVYLTSFIGVDKRVLYNGDVMVLTYALNQYYFTNYRQPLLLGWSLTPDVDHALYSDIYILNSPPVAVGFLVGQTYPYSSTVAQRDVAQVTVWTIGSYAIGVVRGYLGRVYLSLVNSNTDTPPSAQWHQADTVGYSNTFQVLSNFTIFVPTAVYYSSLPYSPTIETELRGIVDKIIPAGINYTITPY